MPPVKPPGWFWGRVLSCADALRACFARDRLVPWPLSATPGARLAAGLAVALAAVTLFSVVVRVGRHVGLFGTVDGAGQTLPRAGDAGGSATTTGTSSAGALPRRLLPPLPVIEDFNALGSFLRNSVDDVAEDAAKLGCLWFAHRLMAIPTALLLPGDPHSLLFHTATILGTTLVYQPCDQLGDFVGDSVEVLLEPIFALLGLGKDKKRDVPHHPAPFLVRVADDGMEDGFKVLCLWSHYQVGDLIRRSYLSLDHPLVHVAGKLLVWSLPASKYTMCNEYGDDLGDFVQYNLYPSASLRTLPPQDKNTEQHTQ